MSSFKNFKHYDSVIQNNLIKQNNILLWNSELVFMKRDTAE
jgi:hypothetical protein